MPDLSVPPSDLPSALAMTFKHALDPFQAHAVAAIERDANVLVCARTGSGKTLVGEYRVALSVARGGRVFYTVPVKSLANEKYAALRRLFPHTTVGILTGDVKANPEAAVVVMTAEVLRNALFKAGTATARLGLCADLNIDALDAVVMDEAHFIGDPDRGAVWEETLILLPPRVKLVLLSATIHAPEEVGTWLAAVRGRDCVLTVTTYRVVPLTHGLLNAEGGVDVLLDSGGTYNAATYARFLQGRDKAAAAHAKFAEALRGAGHSGDATSRSAAEAAQGRHAAVVADAKAKGAAAKKPLAFPAVLNGALCRLRDTKLLPAFLFVMSRKEVEAHAAAVQVSLWPTDPQSDYDTPQPQTTLRAFDFYLRDHRATLERLPQYAQMRDLLARGVAFHHSGVLPVLKEAVELLYGRGLLPALFATSTVAVGLNMPCKCAVFLDLRTYDSALSALRPLRTDEYMQAAGRAGRRGLDVQGLALYLPARTPLLAEEMRRTLTGAMPPLVSRLAVDYDLLLKTLHSGGAHTWQGLLAGSFRAAQARGVATALRKELASLSAQRLALGLTPDQRAALAERGVLEGAVRASVNATKRVAQAGLSTWENKHQGPVWAAATKGWAVDVRLATAQARAEAQLEDAEADPANAEFEAVGARMAVLRELGYVVGGEEEDSGSSVSGSVRPWTLTSKGVAATEVNEAPALLLVEALEFRRLRPASHLAACTEPAELTALLGAFLTQEARADEDFSLAELRVPDKVRAALQELDAVAAGVAATERRVLARYPAHVAAVAASPPGAFDLRLLFVEIGARWASEPDTSAAHLCEEYGMFAGNVTRGLFKLTNIVDECVAVATLAADVGTLQTLRDVRGLLLRDVAIPDSLYVRGA